MTVPQEVKLARHAGDLDDDGHDVYGGGATGFATKTYGGLETVDPHGSAGSTETIDLASGNWHRLTLNADCTITVIGFTVDTGCSALVKVTQDGSGGHAIVWDPDVVFATGVDDQPAQGVDAVSWFVLASDEGDTVIYGFPVGSGSSALTVKNEGSSLATAATSIDFVGSLVTASGTGAGKTVTVTGALDDLTDVVITSATSGDRVRYNGSNFVNSALRWEPHVDYAGSVMLDSAGDPVMHEVLA